ncbi:hypothetical protein [Stenotrophomonas sp.]|uniref:hypothetical protein n=1 Tax=Stenotrophomonas sp. TaxID=69392 RepID=UPI0028AA10BB|nr:hypothetical protein [Stenotrophomonas sp.]
MTSAELKALALQLDAAMPPLPPARVEVLLATGEALSASAMTLARLYERAGAAQRAALDAVAKVLLAAELAMPQEAA